jgi:3-deoxy-D-arabino-heptulosonate 7-phosphate (DAHP) synthase class II
MTPFASLTSFSSLLGNFSPDIVSLPVPHPILSNLTIATQLTNAILPSTLTSNTGLKTRHFGTIINELTACIRIHTECGSRLGGVSLEFTGELNDEGFSVTECVGGSMELGEEELGLRYQVCISCFRVAMAGVDMTFLLVVVL